MYLGLLYFPIVWILLSIIVVGILQHLRMDNTTIGMFAAACALSAWRFVGTSPYDYTYDIDNHIGYARYIMQHWWLPPPFGWQDQHPPVYYIFAAIGGKIAQWLGAWPMQGMRFVAMLFYYGFAINGALLLRYAVYNKIHYRLALALLLFWPGLLVNSVKISDDTAQLFFASLTFYYCLRWSQEHTPNLLRNALVAAGFSIATKNSGLVAIAMVAVMVLLKWRKRETDPKRLLRNRAALIGLAALAVGLTANYGRIAYWRHITESDISYMVNRHDDLTVAWDYVGNHLNNYLTFNVVRFVQEPYPELHRWRPPARNFWEVSLKSLIYGKDLPHGYMYAKCANFFFLLLMAYGLLPVVLSRGRLTDYGSFYRFTILGIGLCFGMLMGARLMMPVSNHADARYIYYVLAMMIPIYGQTLETDLVLGHTRRRIFGLAAGGGFLLSSLVFIIAQVHFR